MTFLWLSADATQYVEEHVSSFSCLNGKGHVNETVSEELVSNKDWANNLRLKTGDREVLGYESLFGMGWRFMTTYFSNINTNRFYTID